LLRFARSLARSLDELVACASFDSHHCNNFFYKNGVKEERTKKARNKKIWKKKFFKNFIQLEAVFFSPLSLIAERERETLSSQ
jgi:hypothetical protein